jgi:hypothetical protein
MVFWGERTGFLRDKRILPLISDISAIIGISGSDSFLLPPHRNLHRCKPAGL